MIQSKPKPKKCRVCKTKFTPTRPMQLACTPACALSYGKSNRDKLEAKRKSERAKQTRAQKEAAKTKPQLTKEAQHAFNAFIRLRDKDQPCICCGSYGAGDDWLTGGKWDAGHFLSRGAYPELRFNEDNCHKQLKTCNGGSGRFAKKGRTVGQGYKRGIIERIGIERVEWLEGPHKPAHYTHDELRAIRDEYRSKVNALRKQSEAA